MMYTRTVTLTVTIMTNDRDLLDADLIADATHRGLEGDDLCCGSGSIKVSIAEHGHITGQADAE